LKILERGLIMEFFGVLGLMILAIAAVDEKEREEKKRRRWDEIDWFFWRKW